MTVSIDDAGVGDLLFGVVIGAYRHETQEFTYGIIDVKYFKPGRFRRKEYLRQASNVVFQLLDRLKLGVDEPILICRGSIFERAIKDLKEKYGDDRVQAVKIIGEPQHCTETAYLDEIRNLGYEPLPEREQKRAKSFFDMMKWLEKNPNKLEFAKTGWPKLGKYRLFRSARQT